jgi:IS5 family transposase
VRPLNQLDLKLNLLTTKTRKCEYLEEMNCVVPWSTLVALIELHAPRARTGRPLFIIKTILSSSGHHTVNKPCPEVRGQDHSLECS